MHFVAQYSAAQPGVATVLRSIASTIRLCAETQLCYHPVHYCLHAGHCKSLESHYNTVGETFNLNSGVIIAKVC
jgi:hypothetical protein